MDRPFDRIAAEVSGWPGVTTGPGRFGAVTYLYGTREIGHVHGNSHADLPFPTRLRNEIVAGGRAQPHHFLPESGWVTAPLYGEGAVERALELFQMNYGLILAKKQAAGMPPG